MQADFSNLTNRAEIISLADRYKVPAIYPASFFSKEHAVGVSCHDPAMSRYRRPTIEGGYSFSQSCLLTGRANCLSNISSACGRFIVRFRRACRLKRTLSASCRTIFMQCRRCLPAMPISRRAGAKSKAVFLAGYLRCKRSRSQVQRRETGIWLRRFWEHTIRDDADFARHVDYIHFNPVRHRSAEGRAVPVPSRTGDLARDDGFRSAQHPIT